MIIKEGLKYSKEHEWVRVEDGEAYVGITDYAQNALGDVVFVELPEIGAGLNAGDSLGVVESVKAASDVYTPVAGTVIKVNQELTENPGKINESPYEAWIAVIKLSDPSQLDELMDEKEYKEFCSKEG
ncbi:MAG: glycine cleavage system protein GcvH [Clostridiaceae bacterium]|nr:glycine cleavage system protein GcvH [Clostridiaceae bacterium]